MGACCRESVRLHLYSDDRYRKRQSQRYAERSAQWQDGHRELHPDRCSRESRQLRGRPGKYQWRTNRHQYRHLFPDRQLCRMLVCDTCYHSYENRDRPSPIRHCAARYSWHRIYRTDSADGKGKKHYCHQRRYTRRGSDGPKCRNGGWHQSQRYHHRDKQCADSQYGPASGRDKQVPSGRQNHTQICA